MQMGFGRGITDVVRKLIYANAVVFTIQFLLRGAFNDILGLVPHWTWSRFFIWQFATYLFLHGDIWHILINMFMLWMFGCEIERMWGSRAFLRYYFITGVGAGLFYTLMSPTLETPTIGASGAIYGILVAYAIMFPDRKIMFIFPPIAMKARTYVLLWVGISLLYGVRGSEDGVAHFAHLGGALVGFVYMKQDWRMDAWIKNLRVWLNRHRMKVHHDEEENIEDLRRMIDQLLDKANDIGMENLSAEEKRLLKKASKTLNRKT